MVMGEDRAQCAILSVGCGNVVQRPVRVPALHYRLRSQGVWTSEERVLLGSHRCWSASDRGPRTARFVDGIDAFDHFTRAERAFFIVPAVACAVRSSHVELHQVNVLANT